MNTTLKQAAIAAILGSLPFVVAAGSSEHGHGEGKKIDYSHAEQHPFGRASDPTTAHHTITVSMSDQMRFTPSQLKVERGETVRLVAKNDGKLKHELVLGTDSSLKKHAEMMKKFPGMEHEEPHMAHVSPGEEYVMGWQFTDAGTFAFGCLVPGHFDAGMKGTIVVR